ncbi:hypothetical protein [Natrinema thermotolerans]|uniref:hypothetical protein n=1 Tax=Natrinema thermotolerans TaxID=121872 RepID=UPI0006793F13|nr:hypothetical protein [Natrinema thermotolerans]QCC57280.1 hypothetical protein DVR14_00980 [Natrinema thermotolerans]
MAITTPHTTTHSRTLERDGDEIVVTQVAPQVYHCVRDGVRHVIEVSWRVGELTIVDGTRPETVPQWLEGVLAEAIGLDEVTL